jgi:hypothetical protein
MKDRTSNVIVLPLQQRVAESSIRPPRIIDSTAGKRAMWARVLWHCRQIESPEPKKQ